MVRWCWINFQCRGVLLVWIKVGQGPTALAVGAGGSGLDIFSPIYHFSLRSPSLLETARYRLQYCLKGPLNQKQPAKPGSTGFNIFPSVLKLNGSIFKRINFAFFASLFNEGKLLKQMNLLLLEQILSFFPLRVDPIRKEALVKWWAYLYYTVKFLY